MRRFLRLLSLAMFTFALTTPTWATSLLGTSVTGTLNIAGVPLNVYDPAFFLVPSGFLNTAGTTVTIQNPAVEFGFDNGFNRNTTDFTDNGFTFSDRTTVGSLALHLVFTDPAFAGLTLSKISDTFPGGGFSYSLVGNTITLDKTAFGSDPKTYSAVFSLTSAPEPSSYALLLTALLGVAPLVRRRFAN